MTDQAVRKIIHIDMDAFYASVEQRDHPKLRNVPLVVGGVSGKGVVAAASYEARAFGVKSAMPMREALRKYPKLIAVKPDFDKYKAVSEEIRSIFKRYTDCIEPLSLDEAYLDVTYCKQIENSATLIAQQIKNEIYNELHLVASAGVSYNKFLAKIASDYNKPDGLFVITPDEGAEFIKSLPVKEFHGVGQALAEKLHAKAIDKGVDLLNYDKNELLLMFGKIGSFLYKIARGVDERPVQPDRKRKSIGAENTFSYPSSDATELLERLMNTFDTLWRRYTVANKKAKTITLKVKFNDFESITRSKTIDGWITTKDQAREILLNLFNTEVEIDRPIRLMGASFSNFQEEKTKETQLVLRF